MLKKNSIKNVLTVKNLNGKFLYKIVNVQKKIGNVMLGFEEKMKVKNEKNLY